MHTLCHGKEPVREHGVQMLLKRNPRLSGAVVPWSHPPSSAGSFSAACASLLECCSHPLVFSRMEMQSVSNSFKISGIL